ncbi:uncharacterized protein FIESC28_11169 [Fusarium coffeatum]|uniref:L-tyrosine decarboxylase C-terminal domain-containing protein n=1 Tax=Fusarium coffeatum TaxID=231269 RepID=A0A366QMJ8_9HYPO|nr:uncharacterized protein FIESC28_11169 [Fusarium coffeatum]RBR06154.1 hypothetical protein FIESC28_11169 [Fusarium coffeatum]
MTEVRDNKDLRKDEFDAVHAYFIGPKGTNLPDFRANINTILDELLVARQSYYPEDQAFISKEYRRSPVFQKARSDLRLATEKVAQLLGEHSAPFWSPRYEAHMCTDLTMSSLLGYFMTMLYNPNNVALEASPMTTLVELRVGQQLCKLFGYNTDPQKNPLSWGHITCDGTIANLESIWVARNLKFYPLSLCMAIRRGKLQFIGDRFYASSCFHAPAKTKFKDLQGWDLVNLPSEVILDLPDQLNKQFGITSKFLESALNEYNIQTIGRELLEKEFNISNPIKYFVSKTRHYSWPKGVAIAGLGSGNVVGVDVNNAAQIDIKLLEEHLHECVTSRTPVFAVVAIIGSTEEGAVDRLTEILRLRKMFQEEYGLSFLVHADAAWGGYFATMVNPDRRYSVEEQSGAKPEPEWYLDPKTVEDIKAMAEADSITVDPHKAGYIPYPAGSLVKPGASAMSAWFSNQTIGLNHCGYGKLLGEATFTSARGNKKFLSTSVKNQREKIRDLIVTKTDTEIFASKEAMKIIRDLGSDTNINCFAINWKDENGVLNTDLEEANYLMKRVVDKLSITSPNTDPSTIPIYLTSTQFLPEDYGACAHKFMERMGVHKSDQSLFVIRNVVMSPFPTKRDFISTIMKDLEKVIRDEVDVCRKRNKPGEKNLQFLVQGSSGSPEVYLVFQASFHSVTRRQQVIISAELDDTLKEFFKKRLEESRDTIIMVESEKKLYVKDIINGIPDGCNMSVFMFEKDLGLYEKEKGVVKLKSLVKSRPLNSIHRDIDYPDKFMPFYLYGSDHEAHVTHTLVKSPNISLSASSVSFNPALPAPVTSLLPQGLILGLVEIPEASVQPFSEQNSDLSEDFFFAPGKKFKVAIYKDPKEPTADGPGLLENLGTALFEAEMTLGENVFVDAEGPNEDKLKDIKVESDDWQRKLDEIGAVLDGSHVNCN